MDIFLFCDQYTFSLLHISYEKLKWSVRVCCKPNDKTQLEDSAEKTSTNNYNITKKAENEKDVFKILEKKR